MQAFCQSADGLGADAITIMFGGEVSAFVGMDLIGMAVLYPQTEFFTLPSRLKADIFPTVYLRSAGLKGIFEKVAKQDGKICI